METVYLPPAIDAEVCFLISFPINKQMPVMGEHHARMLERAPYFQPVDIDVKILEAMAVQVEGIHISIQPQTYDNLVQSLECRFHLENALSDVSVQRLQRIRIGLEEILLPAETKATEMWEEYLLLLLQTISEPPDTFVTTNNQALAQFLRSERGRFSPSDIENILASRVRYTEKDLTIVDWEGGVIFAEDGDFQTDIEIIKIAQYQLLRYRLLDKRIENKLQTIRQLFVSNHVKTTFFPAHSRKTVQQIIQERLTILLDFERIDQDLLMIGDWYTAQLYRTLIDEFYLDEWKHTIKEKLDNLESIVRAIQDNFTVSWSYFLDIVQLVGWLLLLGGYFYLFYLDTISYGLVR